MFFFTVAERCFRLQAPSTTARTRNARPSSPALSFQTTAPLPPHAAAFAGNATTFACRSCFDF